MPPIAVTPDVEHAQGLQNIQPEFFKRTLGREYRDLGGAAQEIGGISEEIKTKRKSHDERDGHEDDSYPPKIGLFAEERDEEKEKKRGHPVGYITVESQTEKNAADDRRNEESAAPPAFFYRQVEQIERPDQEERSHYGTEAYVREIYMPEADGKEKGRQEPDALREKFLPQKIKPPNGKDAEDGRRQAEDPGLVDPAHGEKDRLNVHKEALSPVILRVKYFELAGLKRLESVIPVHGFVGIKPGRIDIQFVQSQKSGEGDYQY